MVCGRVPLPTARFSLCHVGAVRGGGSRAAPRPHPQERGGLRGGATPGWASGSEPSLSVQLRFLSIISTTSLAAPAQRAASVGRPRQRHLSSCPRLASVAPRAPRPAGPGFPAYLQSEAQPSGAGVEAHPPTRHPQSLLSVPRRTPAGRPWAVLSLGQTQRNPATIMRNYL